jgi:uncharacterized membrane protein YphA (DoxX/SURF4 family)
MKLAHLPLRLAIGVFFLNSGLEKRTLEEQPAQYLQGMAAGAVPALSRLKPTTFARLLAGSEIAIGAALLLPVVPSVAVGAALCGFSGGLLRLYWTTPGMHQPGSVRPTQQGIPIAKDLWLFGAGLTLILDDLIGNGRNGCKKGGRRKS